MLRALCASIQRLCPESCPRCGFESDLGFCGDCRLDFPRIESACPRCGLPLPCGPCPGSHRDWHIDAIHSPYVYGLPLARFLRDLKYRGQRRLGRALGLLLAAELKAAATGVDAIVGTPLHQRRLRARTFNQADEIALALASHLRMPRLVSGIRRKLDTQPQTELNRKNRIENPLRAFSVSRNLRGLRIAIVDDVITTGATVNALADTLKSAGAIRVEAWSVARSVSFDLDRA